MRLDGLGRRKDIVVGMWIVGRIGIWFSAFFFPGDMIVSALFWIGGGSGFFFHERG